MKPKRWIERLKTKMSKDRIHRLMVREYGYDKYLRESLFNLSYNEARYKLCFDGLYHYHFVNTASLACNGEKPIGEWLSYEDYTD